MVDTKLDCLLVTFKIEEFEAVLRQFPELDVTAATNTPGSIRTCSVITKTGKSIKVGIARTPHQGNIDAVSFIQRQISKTSPRLVMTVGIAGAVPSEDIFLGDVLLAKQIHDFTLGAVTESGREEASRPGYLRHSVVEYITSLTRDQFEEWSNTLSGDIRPNLRDPTLTSTDSNWNKRLSEAISKGMNRSFPTWRDGPIASSDVVVKTPEVVNSWLKSDRKILGCDMESAGAAKACEDPHIPLLVVRGISDIIGLKRSNVWERYACDTAASFARELLSLDCVDAIASRLTVERELPPDSEEVLSALRKVLDHIDGSDTGETASECYEAFELFKQLPPNAKRQQAARLFRTLDKPMKFMGNKPFVLAVANACLDCCDGENLEYPLAELEARARICGLSWAYQRTGELEFASREARKAIEISRGIGSGENLAFCSKCLGRLERIKAENEEDATERSRNFKRSVKLLNEAIVQFGNLLNHGLFGEEVGDCYSLLGRTYLSMARLEDAQECAEKARVRINIKNKDYLDLCILDGDISAKNKNYKAAVLAYQKVTQTVDEENYQYSEIVARARLQMGRALMQLNEENQAISEFEEATRIWRHYEEWDLAAHSEWESIQATEDLGFRALRLLNKETPLVRSMSFKICQEQLADKDPRAIAQRRTYRGLDDAVWRSCIQKAKQRIARRQGL